MEKNLKRQKKECYYYEDGIRIVGVHSKISGDVTGVFGDVTGISGNVSGISGNVTGISGNVTGIFGDINLCEITIEEREKGIKIEDLVVKD